MAMSQTSKYRMAGVQDFSIKKEGPQKFLVTITGSEPDGGYVVNVHARMYEEVPENWELQVTALSTMFAHPHIVSPWATSITMELSEGTTEVTVIGRGDVITKKVPH